ncbi:MAG: hypothetical protein RKE49_00015 [Oceanicaulis sp.]
MVGHVTYSGLIRYLHDAKGENGRERFSVTRMSHGERTLRAVCEMDEIELVRDVTYTVDRDFRPVDCFNRLQVNGAFEGSSWFHFQGAQIECQGHLPGEGRISETIKLSKPTPVFACHPLFADGYHALAFDHASAERKQHLTECTNSSMMLDGSTSPRIGVVEKKLEYVGREPVEVEAGRFVADHYRIHPMRVEAPDWTPLDFWVAGGERIFIKLRWDMIAMTYELAELHADPALLAPPQLAARAA